jgi:hypothetical protein
MSDPSTVSGVLGIVVLFAVVVILGLLNEWRCER